MQLNVIPFRYKVLSVSFLIFHLFLPMRHYLINSDVRFTNEGYELSWRLISNEKQSPLMTFFDRESRIENYAQGGHPAFFVRNVCDPYFVYRTAKKLCSLQEKRYYLDYLNRHKGERLTSLPNYKPFVTVEASCSLSSRNEQAYLVDPSVNLCQVECSIFSHNNWIFRNFSEGLKAVKSSGRKLSEKDVYNRLIQEGLIIKSKQAS